MSTLLLRLAAPLQSWGSDSKLNIRKTNLEPTKSAVIGMLASALGIQRDDDQSIQFLNKLKFAVRVDREGTVITDFQIAHQKKSKTKIVTHVTYRDYLSDAVFLVGLESEDAQLLQKLDEALKNPIYPLFLGRRSCPPTLPIVIGFSNDPLLNAMQNTKLLVDENNESHRILIDADPMEAGVRFQNDMALSFSQNHRKFQKRGIKEYCINRDENKEHDPFEELR